MADAQCAQYVKHDSATGADANSDLGAVCLLSEMSADEASEIEIPDSFLPSFTSDISAVPTARSLLDNALLEPLARPWYVSRTPSTE